MNIEVMLRCKSKTKKSSRKLLVYLTTFAIALYMYHVFAKKRRSFFFISEEEIAPDGRQSDPNNPDGKVRLSNLEDRSLVEVHQGNPKNGLQKGGKVVQPHRGEANVKQTKSRGCGASWYTNWEKIRQIKPLIQLDSRHYVTAILVNGPNNQLIGLRDTMYLAIRLNRTLILPGFFKHKTDTSVARYSATVVPASQRVDVASVASLMSLKPHSELKSICGKSFDDFYFTSYKASKSVLSDSPLPVRLEEKLLHSYPKNMKQSFNAHAINGDKDSLHSLYNSSGKCALYAFPFHTVGVKGDAQTLRKTAEEYFNGLSPSRKTHNIDPDKLTDSELYSLTVHSTRKPLFIEEIVDEFLNAFEMHDNAYLSAHWRYDLVDFQVRCRHEERLKSRGKEFMIEMCDKIQRIEAKDVAGAIAGAIQRLEKKLRKKIFAIYFAAPLTMKEFISDMKSALRKDASIDNITVLTQEDLQGFLNRYSSCGKLNDNFDDIFSQLEMEVCSHSTAFFRSPSSSWSQVISTMRVLRSGEDYDGNLFRISWEVASKRLKNS